MTKTSETFAQLRIEQPPATLREIALDRIRRAIISGMFEPGARLVERTLCDQMNVSRSVIREVLRHLEAEGLVENISKQGPIVARLNWADAKQIYEIRTALETAAVARCAAIADDEVKSRLAHIIEELERGSRLKDPGRILDAGTEFYAVIFGASGQNIAWDIVCRLNGRISRLRAMTLSHGNRTTSGPAQIRKIFEAIRRNDGEAAASACRQHIAEASEIAREVLSGSGQGLG